MSATRRTALLALGAAASAPAAPVPAMPRVKIGGREFSRLMVGGNPVSGHSHQNDAANKEMRDYFTAENVKRMLRACEQAGIDTWQSRADRHIMRLLNEYRNEGSRIQWVAQTASEMGDVAKNIRECAAAGAAAVYHHGSMTDKLWQAGKIEQVREMVKVMRGSGVLAGVGTHIPEVVDYIESHNWDLDFYMTAVYNISRTREEALKVAGPHAEGELFWDPDRECMLERVKKASRPCLVFKVYGAGRKCGTRAEMLDALRLVFRYAKPNDPVVLGMFPKRKEQVRENCDLLCEALSGRQA